MNMVNHNQCPVKMRGGVKCRIGKLSRDETCICHSQNPDKDLKRFEGEIDGILAANRPGAIPDFTGTIFPRDFAFRRKTFESSTYFDRAEFLGPADFNGASFSSDVSFENAIFHDDATFNDSVFDGDAHFQKAIFKNGANFEKCTFKKGNFSSTRFEADTSFGGSEFQEFCGFGGATSAEHLDFLECKFRSYVIFWGFRTKGATSFTYAVFEDGANFHKAEFTGPVNFSLASLSGNYTFAGAKFQNKTYFETTRFLGKTRFAPTTFESDVCFQRSVFGAGSDTIFDGGELASDDQMFGGEVDFTRTETKDSSQVTFRKVSLDRCRFLETDVTAIQFRDVKWPRKGKYLSRLYSFDELANESKQEFVLLAQLYRRFQQNFIDDYQFTLSGHFYIGEQIHKRKDQLRRGRYLSWLINWAYFVSSRYGQSMRLPASWLGAVLLAFPAFFLYGGIKLGKALNTNYEWSWNPSDLMLLKADYWEAIAINLGFVSLNRNGITKYLTDIFQQNVLVLTEVLLVITFITLFLLALRRRFKRKSF